MLFAKDQTFTEIQTRSRHFPTPNSNLYAKSSRLNAFSFRALYLLCFLPLISFIKDTHSQRGNQLNGVRLGLKKQTNHRRKLYLQTDIPERQVGKVPFTIYHYIYKTRIVKRTFGAVQLQTLNSTHSRKKK